MTPVDSPSAASTPEAGPSAALADVRARMIRAAGDVGRSAEAVTLVAVSKTFGPDRIEPVLAAGQRVFGENRVQEAQGKWPELRTRYPDMTLHLIGPLQTNKVREAVALFDVIQSVDRPKLAAALAAEMARQERRLPVCIQVNIGEEPQKSGVMPEEAPAFIAGCRETHGLDVRGVMAIPPAGAPPAPYFGLLREIGARAGLPWLSMGMSGDFEEAVMLGATHVRVGSAIFGARDPMAQPPQ